VIFLGYMLGVAGLLLKLPGRRQEAEWRTGTDGRPTTIAGWGGRAPTGMRRVDSDG